MLTATLILTASVLTGLVIGSTLASSLGGEDDDAATDETL